MISTVWDIIFLSITIVFTLISFTIIKDGWTRVNPVAWDIVSVYAITGSALTLTIAIHGMIQTAVEWDLADCMLLTIAVISVSLLIRLITELLDLDRSMKDLGLAVVKLRGMQTAFRRLDSLLYSRECDRWLKSVDRIISAYDFCSPNYIMRFILIIARQMLNTANDLVQEGDKLLHPKYHFYGTMNYYKKKVIDYIKARDNNSSRLLGIWGMGGVGKSSLLKLVRDSRLEYDDGSFKVVFVHAGSGCTVDQLQEAIATGLELSHKGDETTLKRRIHDHLEGTSFLLLLDDLWEYIDLRAVGIPWPFGTIPAPLRAGSGSVQKRHRKVVLTSRINELCYDMGCLNANIIQMQFILLGIWGIRGVGKTALLRLVRDSYTRSKCFDHIMFVGAGTGCVVKNVQHAIAINLGLDWGTMSSSDDLSRAQVIFDHLKDKSFLLLLDDIRDPLNWWAVGLPAFSHRRQKIILASRTEHVCALMGCVTVNTIEMQCLGENDSWELFKGKVRLDDHHRQVHHFGKQMVSLCEGLPLALCSLGRTMSNKRDPREWRSVYSQLSAMKSKPFWEIDPNIDTLLFYMVPEKPSENTSPQEDESSHPGIHVNHGYLAPPEINRDVGIPSVIAGWTNAQPSLTFKYPGAGQLKLPS